jgi:hypothetical protein
MNLKRLVKHYEKLTPRERFSLIMAAAARGDESERKRLMRSSPTALFRVPAYRGYSEAFCDTASLYLIQQLESGVRCWKCMALFEGEEETSERIANCLGLFGHQFVTRREAWNRLCAEYGIEGDLVLSVYPGFALLRDLDEMISNLAYSHDQAAVVLREKDEDLRPVTTDELHQAMKHHIENHATAWM